MNQLNPATQPQAHTIEITPATTMMTIRSTLGWQNSAPQFLPMESHVQSNLHRTVSDCSDSHSQYSVVLIGNRCSHVESLLIRTVCCSSARGATKWWRVEEEEEEEARGGQRERATTTTTR